MDERYAVDTTEGGILTAVQLQERPAESSPIPVSEGIKCAQNIAKNSVITLAKYRNS